MARCSSPVAVPGPVQRVLPLGVHAIGWAVAVLMFSGFSDWADGKIARLVANQSSRLGALLDPAVDRVYMLVIPVGLAIAHVVPWWIVLTLIGRDGELPDGSLPESEAPVPPDPATLSPSHS